MLRIVVKVYDLKTGSEEISRAIDCADGEGMRWYKKVTIWAANNGKGLQAYAERDERLANDNAS